MTQTSLQALLEQVRAQVARKKDKAKRPGFAASGEEYEHQWAEVYQHSGWVLRIWIEECACGHRSHGLEGLYEERKHPRLGHTIQRRIASMDSVPDGYEASIETRSSFVPLCLACSGLSPEVIEEAINAAPEELDPESEVAHSGADGAGCEGEDLAA